METVLWFAGPFIAALLAAYLARARGLAAMATTIALLGGLTATYYFREHRRQVADGFVPIDNSSELTAIQVLGMAAVIG